PARRQGECRRPLAGALYGVAHRQWIVEVARSASAASRVRYLPGFAWSFWISDGWSNTSCTASSAAGLEQGLWLNLELPQWPQRECRQPTGNRAKARQASTTSARRRIGSSSIDRAFWERALCPEPHDLSRAFSAGMR